MSWPDSSRKSSCKEPLLELRELLKLAQSDILKDHSSRKNTLALPPEDHPIEELKTIPRFHPADKWPTDLQEDLLQEKSSLVSVHLAERLDNKLSDWSEYSVHYLN